jgi:predicted CXXCH cytochrome family protein
MDTSNKTLIILLIAFVIFPIYLYAAQGTLSDDAQMCIGCHSDNKLTKQLQNKETLSLFINGDEFASSAHSTLGCSGCHTDISMDNHPQEKKIKSKKDYSADSSKTCAMCHSEDQLKTKPTHRTLMDKASCSECHGSHYIKKLEEWKKGISEPRYCLTCHRYDLSMKMKSGEVISLYMNEPVFKNSIHGNLSCGSCHMGFSKTEHPTKAYKNKNEYLSSASKICSMCHTDEQLKKKLVHSTLVGQATCIECHGSHTVKGITAQKATTKDTEYCLSCHKRRLTMTMKNGESLSVTVDEAVLRNSAHKTLQCIECHTGFSKREHPVRGFKSLQDYSISSLSLCKKCHADASHQYESSIHFSLLNAGNPKAPSCEGCHGKAHTTIKATIDKTFGIKSCNKCHADMNSSYETSIHGKERAKGNEKAPSCSSCHNAHNVESSKMTTKIKDGCLKCHKDTEKVHNKWLSNPPVRLPTFVGTHFDGVSCAACHSPGAKHAVYLSLYDRKTGNPVSEEELLKIFDTDPAGLKAKMDTNGDGDIDAKELWNIYRQSYKKGMSTMFVGKMDVQMPTEAHNIGAKAEAVKDCEKCHRPYTDFIENVFLVTKGADGKPAIFNAKKDVLNSVYTILPMSKFYALGSTKTTLFDILFIVALIGGIAVPIGHITLRIITSPLRSLRKMGKGGKK